MFTGIGWRRLADAFLFSSAFLALCAIGMVWQTAHLFQLVLPPALPAFTLFGTLCSYNFHWYFTPADFGGSRKTNWSVRNKRVHALLFFIAFFGAVCTAWLLRAHWLLLLGTAFVTFLYSAPKVPHRWATYLQQVAIGKTLFLALAWTHVTALLPLLLAGDMRGPAAMLFVANRFFLIYAVCILFDYRDRESDKAAGIRSLLTRLEHRGIRNLFAVIVGLFLVSSLLLQGYWQPSIVVALGLPGLVVALLFRYSINNRGDYFYYCILDGLMALSVPLVYFFGTWNTH